MELLRAKKGDHKDMWIDVCQITWIEEILPGLVEVHFQSGESVAIRIEMQTLTDNWHSSCKQPRDGSQ